MPDMGSFGCPIEGCNKTPSHHSDPSNKGHSCVDKCGELYLDPFGNTECSCLSVCNVIGEGGNCCHDAEAVCPNIKPKPGPKPKPAKKPSCENNCGKEFVENSD